MASTHFISLSIVCKGYDLSFQNSQQVCHTLQHINFHHVASSQETLEDNFNLLISFYFFSILETTHKALSLLASLPLSYTFGLLSLNSKYSIERQETSAAHISDVFTISQTLKCTDQWSYHGHRDVDCHLSIDLSSFMMAPSLTTPSSSSGPYRLIPLTSSHTLLLPGEGFLPVFLVMVKTLSTNSHLLTF